MDKLVEYVMQHAQRGACQCGRCFDAQTQPEKRQPIGHTADLIFFKVNKQANPKAEDLRKLLEECHGAFLFDHKEHNYMEIGAFIGDQGLAMMLMGLGALLGMWDLLTPTTMLGLTGPEAMNMAGMGMVAIKAKKERVESAVTLRSAEQFVPRTDAEIVVRIEERKESDPFGFEISDYLIRLPLELANPFLKVPNDPSWKQAPRDRETILKEMHDYMEFAWEKANNFRGLSAARNMFHYTAWIWLLGDDLGDLTDYQHYGKDNLVKICEAYGWDAKQWDDGVRANSEVTA